MEEALDAFVSNGNVRRFFSEEVKTLNVFLFFFFIFLFLGGGGKVARTELDYVLFLK